MPWPRCVGQGRRTHCDSPVRISPIQRQVARQNLSVPLQVARQNLLQPSVALDPSWRNPCHVSKSHQISDAEDREDRVLADDAPDAQPLALPLQLLAVILFLCHEFGPLAGSRSWGMWTSIRTWKSMARSPLHGVEDEVPFEGAPVLLLHTTGARSAQQRVHPLMYLGDDGRYLLFASAAGVDRSPAWYWNPHRQPRRPHRSRRRAPRRTCR
jgi:hypothetical protein